MRKYEVVLVIDDDQGVKNLTRDVLELRGHSVLTAATGDDALFLFNRCSKKINIVLLDAPYPGEVRTERIFEKILETNPEVKIIVTSIYSHDWSPEQVFECGAAGFLRKPYRVTELLRMVERVQAMQ